MNITRAIQPAIKADLREKMVFIGGPRQVGKTTLAKGFIKNERQYFSWDSLEDRALLKQHQIDPSLGTVVLDEIHKYARWRMLLKGLYDKNHEKLKVIVTGSAKLDHLRKGGDSLFGRFFYFRLHPFTISEIDPTHSGRALERLLRFGGFPEPYIKAEERFLKRWQRERISRVVNQDLNDLHYVKEISLVELLVDLLPSRVGSLLSVRSLQEDLEVSPNTVSSWILLLESIYYCYRIAPYGVPKVRAIKKANKLYLWDWSVIEDAGARFENLVASHLYKYCHYLEDTEGSRMELRFLRDVDGREIDFVVLKDKKPLFAVECKSGEGRVSPSLHYYRQRTSIPKFYQVHSGTKELQDGNIRVLPFTKFCSAEGLV